MQFFIRFSLVFVCFYGKFVPNIGQLICKNEEKQNLILVKLYNDELATNDDTGELWEFICELEQQNLAMEKAFETQKQNGKMWRKSSETFDGEAEFFRHKFEIIRRKDNELAELFTKLRSTFYSTVLKGIKRLTPRHFIKNNKMNGKKWTIRQWHYEIVSVTLQMCGSLMSSIFAVLMSIVIVHFCPIHFTDKTLLEMYGSMAECLRNQLTQFVLMLTQRFKISKEEIMPKKEEPTIALKLIKEFAELWREIKGKQKSKSDYKGTENGKNNGQNEREKCWDSDEKQRKMLRLVFTAVNGDGNIMALNGATKVNGGGRRSQKRRRKKRDLVLLILLIALLISLFFTVYSYCLHSSNDDSLEQQNADMEMLLVVRQANEIFVKFRYGDDETDKKGNPKSDHIYIVVDGKEFDFVGDGARSRSAHFCKKCPTGMFQFDPPLIVPPETVESVDAIFEAMLTGHWPPDSHTYALHSCIDFAYQFVCRLNNGICPEKDRWPRPFVEFDQRWVHRMAHLGRLSVFDFRYRISPQNYELSRDILLPIGNIISSKKQS